MFKLEEIAFQSSVCVFLFLGIPQQHPAARQGLQGVPPLHHSKAPEGYQSCRHLSCKHGARAEEGEWADWKGENAEVDGKTQIYISPGDLQMLVDNKQ